MARHTATLMFVGLLWMGAASAAEPSSPPDAAGRVAAADRDGGFGEPTRPAEVQAGSLLLKRSDGMRPAPTLATDVEVRVTGLLARTRVVQRFHNPSADWVEGVYVFPLPERSAVDVLRMVIGDRVLEGDIQTRAKAKATYQRAKAEGRKATLLEQERPNLFTTSVANLGPGEELEVAIEYQEDLRYDSGRFNLRFPMVVGPKYIPGRTKVVGFDGSGWAANTDEVSDAARITPPVVGPESSRTHPATIHVSLDAGFRLDEIESPSHAIRVSAKENQRYSVSLVKESVPADSDFVLSWTPVVGEAPGAALFHEEWQGESYVLLMVMPPEVETVERARLPRETIFVIDTSGSMHGDSIVQAKASLELALDRLLPGDFFNVIEFDSKASRLFAESQPAARPTVAHAKQWVQRLSAEGGTEMLSALSAALAGDAERSAVRQIVFITDGAVGNEEALFAFIKANLGRSRLFTVGIGSAPNSHFMTKAAEFGRGTFSYVGQPSEVRTKMGELFAKLESPVLHDLEIAWDVRGAEAWPNKIPDLYLGEPVVVAAKLRSLDGSVVLKGRRGAEDLLIDLPLEGGARESGIAKFWARRKIAGLMSSLHEGAAMADVKQAVAGLGLQHHLVTRFTSLVAVDVTPTAPPDVELETRPVPTLLPKGWSLRRLFGGADTEAEARARANSVPKPLPRSTVAAVTNPATVVNQGRLPQGGTPAPLLLWLGIACIAAAVTLLRVGQRG
jgi:Ca-activated chloride channel family protein